MANEKLYLYNFSIFFKGPSYPNNLEYFQSKGILLPENLYSSFVLRGHRIFFQNTNLLGILAQVFSPCKSSSYLSGCTCLQGFMRNVEVTFFDR